MAGKVKTKKDRIEELGAIEQKESGGAAFDPASQQRPLGDQAQEPKRRIGQFGGKGGPPLMKK